MYKKKLIKTAVSAALIGVIAQLGAEACTGVYVGKNVSEDGSVMIARTEDMVSDESKRFIIHPAQDHEPGESYTDAFGLRIDYPAHTYRYSAVPGSRARGIGDAPYGEAGFNELGVGATSTLTAYPNEKAIAADPFVETGLHELSANDIILSQAATAKEGIEIIARIVDEQGSGEGNIIMTSDKNEAWYMEIYTGHQYAAIKLPDDMAAVIPNAFMLGEIDVSSPDVIVSPDLVSLPTQKGFLKQKNGKINLFDTYSAARKDSDNIRVWGGSRLLHRPSLWDNPYKSDYELLFKPTKKIAIKDVMNTFRSRYENTKYSLDIPGNKYIRAIGTARQEECHILQIHPQKSIAAGCVEWLSMGNCEFSPFVPYYASAITDTPYMCRVDAADYNEYSIYWNARGLSTICATNRPLYGNAVKEFMSKYEDDLIKQEKIYGDKLNRAADKTTKANEFCYDFVYDSFNKHREIYSKLIRFIAKYEGEDEIPDNKAVFKIDISPAMDSFVGHATSLPPIVTSE